VADVVRQVEEEPSPEKGRYHERGSHELDCRETFMGKAVRAPAHDRSLSEKVAFGKARVIAASRGLPHRDNQPTGEPLSAEVGRRYRETILERGGSVDGQQLVRDFLGREPNADAFLRGLGLAGTPQE
jgi:hypothetical protein